MKRLLMAATLMIFLGSCYNDKYDKLYPATPATNTCDTTAVSYKTAVVPILNSYCAISGGCHSAADHTLSTFDFSTYAGIQPEATSDILINDVNLTPGRGHNAMPLNQPKLSQCNINILTAWVNQGALNN